MVEKKEETNKMDLLKKDLEILNKNIDLLQSNLRKGKQQLQSFMMSRERILGAIEGISLAETTKK